MERREPSHSYLDILARLAGADSQMLAEVAARAASLPATLALGMCRSCSHDNDPHANWCVECGSVLACAKTGGPAPDVWLGDHAAVTVEPPGTARSTSSLQDFELARDIGNSDHHFLDESSSRGTTESSLRGTTESSSRGTTESSSRGTTECSSWGTTECSSRGATESSSRGTTESSLRGGTTESSSRGTTESSSWGTTESSSRGTTESSSRGTAESSSRGAAESSSQGTTESSSRGTTESSSRGATGEANRTESRWTSQRLLPALATPPCPPVAPLPKVPPPSSPLQGARSSSSACHEVSCHAGHSQASTGGSLPSGCQGAQKLKELTLTASTKPVEGGVALSEGGVALSEESLKHLALLQSNSGHHLVSAVHRPAHSPAHRASFGDPQRPAALEEEEETQRYETGVGRVVSATRFGGDTTRHWQTSSRYTWRTPDTLWGRGGQAKMHRRSQNSVKSSRSFEGVGPTRQWSSSVSPSCILAAQVEEVELAVNFLTPSLSLLPVAEKHAPDRSWPSLPQSAAKTIVPLLMLEGLGRIITDDTVEDRVSIHTHTCTHACTYTCTHICVRTHARTYGFAHACTQKARTHAHTKTNTHTHTCCIHTHTAHFHALV